MKMSTQRESVEKKEERTLAECTKGVYGRVRGLRLSMAILSHRQDG